MRLVIDPVLDPPIGGLVIALRGRIGKVIFGQLRRNPIGVNLRHAHVRAGRYAIQVERVLVILVRVFRAHFKQHDPSAVDAAKVDHFAQVLRHLKAPVTIPQRFRHFIGAAGEQIALAHRVTRWHPAGLINQPVGGQHRADLIADEMAADREKSKLSLVRAYRHPGLRGWRWANVGAVRRHTRSAVRLHKLRHHEQIADFLA